MGRFESLYLHPGYKIVVLICFNAARVKLKARGVYYQINLIFVPLWGFLRKIGLFTVDLTNFLKVFYHVDTLIANFQCVGERQTLTQIWEKTKG